jgi:hypothetical protein
MSLLLPGNSPLRLLDQSSRFLMVARGVVSRMPPEMSTEIAIFCEGAMIGD